jgi:hypothetical protein
MRHSDIRTTLNIYGDVVTNEMVSAFLSQAPPQRCRTAIAFLRHKFVYDRLVHSSELWKGSAAFFQHGQRKGAHVWILPLSGSHQLSAGVLLSVFAPHHSTQVYVIAVHAHLQLNRDRARMLPKSGCHDCSGKGRRIARQFHISAK